MDNEARILLDDVIEFCRRDGREARLINMLEQCGASDFTEDSLTIQVPSRFAYTYLVKQRELVEDYLEQISFSPVRLNIEVTDGTTSMPSNSAPVAPARSASDASMAPSIASSPMDAAPAQTVRVPFENTAPLYGVPAVAAVESQPATPTPAPSKPMAPKPSSEGRGGISVVNTVSPDQFRKMMAEMRTCGNASGVQKPAAAPDTAPTDDSEAVGRADINAKYTFESFVAGDENRHAFNSAMRFAAFAEEPGQCPSLFIYGNSGLGKTHLLFAVRNYLAKEKPYIRVKYANSQAYLDDYMNELGTQRGPGSLIMREYRDADILIIDDVQNIVGKQASVEFFFQLVDGFIREGKKIAFASDKAPKDLAMDERLTSRFSRGMLCLVSEPGFEMKYVILKRYYENIINGAEDLDGLNVDTSLLSMLPAHEGHLTDEHLRHMAEISGNNIRNLESFCERCAGLAAEREAVGGELSAADIDETAKTYFNTTRKVIRIDTVQRMVEEFYHVSHEELIGPRRTANIAFARHVAVYLANSLCEMTTPAIGAEFGGRDHSTVLNSLKVVENKMREDRKIYEDLQNLKSAIMLKS